MTSEPDVAEALREAILRGDYVAGQRLVETDLCERFGAIRSIADHQTAARIIEQLRGQIVRHQFRLALVPGRPAVSLPQHEAIVTAIAAGDPQAAERAMHEHIYSVIEALRGLGPQEARQ